MTSKSFDELTDEELAELERRDWSATEIMNAMSMALKEGDMPATASLLERLARKDPRKAAAILAVIEASR